MAWTKQQKAAHSKRMKAMWAKKAVNVEVKSVMDVIAAQDMAKALNRHRHDPVNHPKHYCSHPSGIECIQVTEHMRFNPGNAIKYIWRADEKDDPIENYEKAIWYLQREIERMKNAQVKPG